MAARRIGRGSMFPLSSMQKPGGKGAAGFATVVNAGS